MLTSFFLLINSILISFLLPLIHNSIPGGDSGELLAAIAPPRNLVFNTFQCLKSEGESWTKLMKEEQQQSGKNKNKKNKQSSCSGSSTCSGGNSNNNLFSNLKKKMSQMAEMVERDNENHLYQEDIQHLH